MDNKDRWIQTFTGRRFSVSRADPAEVCIEDIINALSKICRFAGNCSIFYSVAEHSVRVARRLPPHLQLAGLLHDASEAYLSDVPKPVKDLPEMEGYMVVEADVMRAIEHRFGLPQLSLESDEIKQADREMVSIEARCLMHPLRPDWPLPYTPGVLELMDFQSTGGWTPPEAADRMRTFFNLLHGPCA